MKKIILYTLLTLMSLNLTSCSDDEWGNGDPAMENVYYFGFKEWTAKLNNSYIYNTTVGNSVDVVMQFWCEYKRSYDVTTYFYVTSSNLVVGTDVQLLDGSGNVLSPDANGTYSLVWPNALKGVKNVTVKSIGDKKGSLIISTHDPNSSVAMTSDDVTTTVNNHTDQYEVRCFTQNYKVTVNIK
jgi:hypothetical protein